MLNTAGTELIMEDGKVAGVKAVTADGAPVTIHAKSVILATGGFPGNADMKTQYIGGNWNVYGMMQNTGAGIQMALTAGAAPYNIDMPPMAHFVGPSVITREFSHEDNDIPYGLACTGECLAVNTKGVRTLNEALLPFEGYTVGARFYTIYSKEQIDILRTQGISLDAAGRYLSQGGIKADTPLADIDTVLQSGIDRHFIYKAATLDELAAAIGGDMDAAALKAAVADYGTYAAGAADPLGKNADLYKRLGAPAATSEYYIAVTGSPYIYMTCGGVDVNADMQVLKADGSPIEGLYAVGADSMGVLFTNKKGYANYGGVSMGYVFTSGYVAGKNAAGK
ncbi:Fumarate reductase flavoprotein subunit [bioreactor metagenome]|uniref:Fumarate reductase flavoprotein subunit n=1 Tax=bioreactor metagenome TaxID=1076179 RepID=A0A645BED0_9ZZZZ